MKRKRKVNVKKIIVVILAIIVLIAGVFVIKQKLSGKKEQTVKVVDKLDKYGYTLEDNATSYQKALFKELKEVLNSKSIDEEAYAKVVSQSFLADYFSLNSKLSKNNVGGVQYVYKDYQDNFIKQSTDTVYKYVESNIYGNRKQELPVVKNVEVTNVTQDSYDYLEETDEKAFSVDLTITYEKDMGYQTSATLILVHANNKLEIVKMS